MPMSTLPHVEWRPPQGVPSALETPSARRPASSFEGNRFAAWMVIVLLAACVSLALYDFSLFVSATA